MYISHVITQAELSQSLLAGTVRSNVSTSNETGIVIRVYGLNKKQQLGMIISNSRVLLDFSAGLGDGSRMSTEK